MAALSVSATSALPSTAPRDVSTGISSTMKGVQFASVKVSSGIIVKHKAKNFNMMIYLCVRKLKYCRVMLG